MRKSLCSLMLALAVVFASGCSDSSTAESSANQSTNATTTTKRMTSVQTTTSQSTQQTTTQSYSVEMPTQTESTAAYDPQAERKKFIKNGDNKDSDGDWLPDEYEKMIGTDPKKKDSDDDSEDVDVPLLSVLDPLLSVLDVDLDVLLPDKVRSIDESSLPVCVPLVFFS